MARYYSDLDKSKKTLEDILNSPTRKVLEDLHHYDRLRESLATAANSPMHKDLDDIFNNPIRKAVEDIINNPFYHLHEGMKSSSYRAIADQIKEARWFKEQMETLVNAPHMRFDSIGVVVPRFDEQQPPSKKTDLCLDEVNENKVISVMMPFKVELDLTYHAIIAAVKSLGMDIECLRADDGNAAKPGFMLRNIVDLIVASRLVVADITRYNPNVMYEIGIAHTYGKEVVLISQQVDDLPSNISHNRVLKYLPNKEGYQMLTKELAQIMMNTLK